jgi:hypothetical protein
MFKIKKLFKIKVSNSKIVQTKKSSKSKKFKILKNSEKTTEKTRNQREKKAKQRNLEGKKQQQQKKLQVPSTEERSANLAMAQLASLAAARQIASADSAPRGR